jgi:hypothetical protein
MAAATSVKPSPEERERKLVQATKQFVRGKMSQTEFRREEAQRFPVACSAQ